MNLRVRRVTGESESAILVSCGRVDDQDREVRATMEERCAFFEVVFWHSPRTGHSQGSVEPLRNSTPVVA